MSDFWPPLKPVRAPAPPHVHPCPECYVDAKCNYPSCTVEFNLVCADGTPCGSHAVCSRCCPPEPEPPGPKVVPEQLPLPFERSVLFKVMTAEQWVLAYCAEHDLDWDSLTAGEQTRVTMQIPCNIRCWRVGVSIETKPGKACPECGRPVPLPTAWDLVGDGFL